MSLKAGRVGVAPDQVDEFGKVKSDATTGYTKQEADAKFQTINLSLPIQMLEGSQLVSKNTVEDVFQTMDKALTNKEITELAEKHSVTPVVDGTVLKSFVSNVCVEYDLLTRICNFSFIVRMGTFAHNQPVISGMPKSKSNVGVLCNSSSSTSAPILGFSISANSTNFNTMRVAGANYTEDVDYYVSGSYIIANDVVS